MKFKKNIFLSITCLIILSLVLNIQVAFAAEKTSLVQKTSISDNSDMKINVITNSKNTYIGTNIKDVPIENIRDIPNNNLMLIVDNSYYNSCDKLKKIKIKDLAKKAFSDSKLVVLYKNNTDNFSENQITDLLDLSSPISIDYVNADAKDSQKRLFAYSIHKKDNGSFHITEYYRSPDNTDNNTDINIRHIKHEFSNYNLSNIAHENTLSTANMTAQSAPDPKSKNSDSITSSHNWGARGYVSWTLNFTRRYSDNQSSIWDVAAFIATESNYSSNNVQIDWVSTRMSVSSLGSERLISWSPSNTNHSDSINIGLNANYSQSGGSVGASATYTMQIPDVDITDDSHKSPIFGASGTNYARWEWDYTRGSTAATKTQTLKPMARFENQRGRFNLEFSQGMMSYYGGIFGSNSGKLTTDILTYHIIDRTL